MIRSCSALVTLLAIGGCANFQAVSDFAQGTTQMTGVIQSEFDQLGAICNEQAELTIVVNDIKDEGPAKACQSYSDAQGRLAAVTLQVLNDYAGALAGLANNTTFDVGSDIDTLGGQIQGLHDASGRSLVNSAEVGALTKLVSIVADVATQTQRKAAVERLLSEKEDLRTSGGILRSYFVRDPSAPPGRAEAPYTNLVALTADSLRFSTSTLASAQFRAAEPLRSTELLRASSARRTQLEARQVSTAGSVPAKMASAIDAWLASLDTFERDAFRPDSKQLIDQLKDIRTKVRDAKAALSTLRNR
jgi:hypothetical protein